MLRELTYVWAAPTTALGLILLPFALASGGSLQLHSGVIEICGGWIRWMLQHLTFCHGGASAMTLGHVVIARDHDMLQLTRDHERVHVRQCERWGPLFIPAYLMASLWLVLRGKDPYVDNPFEREAYALE